MTAKEKETAFARLIEADEGQLAALVQRFPGTSASDQGTIMATLETATASGGRLRSFSMLGSSSTISRTSSPGSVGKLRGPWATSRRATPGSCDRRCPRFSATQGMKGRS